MVIRDARCSPCAASTTSGTASGRSPVRVINLAARHIRILTLAAGEPHFGVGFGIPSIGAGWNELEYPGYNLLPFAVLCC
jgi:hypothetical protein